MPHIIFEYTDNIKAEADIPGLLKKTNDLLIAQPNNAFPIGGVRSRAIELKDYRMADGLSDDAFVHISIRCAKRPPEVKKKAFDELFAMIKEHFAELYAKRYLAISMEMNEFDEAGTYKHNNVHARYKK